MRSAQDILAELNASDESPRIEAKRARENAMVNNTACRSFSNLDTLQASNVLRRLRDRGLLEKQGAGNRTHYVLVDPGLATGAMPQQGELHLEGGKQAPEGGKRVIPTLPPSAMVQSGALVFQYPQSPNHQLQAYKLPNNL